MSFIPCPLDIIRLLIGLFPAVWNTAYAQPISKPVPQVIFKDSAFSKILQAYIAQRQPKAIRVYIQSTDKGYKSHLSTAYYYEDIADFPVFLTGRNGRTVF